MSAYLLIARSELRHRWPALLSLALLIGLVGAIVLAGFSGARRAASSVDRFLELAGTAEVRVDLDFTTVETDAAEAIFDEVARVPGVADVIPAHLFFVFVDDDAFGIAASADPRWGTEVDRPRIVEGRLPTSPDEIALNEVAAFEMLGLGVGDRLRGATVTTADLAEMVGSESPDLVTNGPVLDVTVVGITRLPEEVSTGVDVTPMGFATPQFYERYIDEVGGVHAAFVLAPGVNIGATVTRISSSLGDRSQLVVDQHADIAARAADGIRVAVVGLSVFAGVALVVGAISVGQAVTRQVAHVASASAVLNAIGYTRHQRAVGWGLAALPAVAAGAALAAAGAVAASSFVLFGLPRRADPEPGVAVDWTVLGVGLGLLVALSCAWTYWAARHAARTGRTSRPRRGSVVVAALTKSGAPPTAIAGARLAFEPGSGGAAVPVGAALTGTMLGFVGVIGSVAFATSAGRMVDSPGRWGFTWDLGPVYGQGFQDFTELGRAAIEGVDGIAAAGIATDGYVELENETFVGFSLDPFRGDVSAQVLDGRPPATASEVALGTATIESLDVEIGDEVTVTRGPSGGQAIVRVVGTAVLPDTNMTGPSSGALFTPAGLDAHAYSIVSEGLVLRYAPGADPIAIEQRLVDAGGLVDLLARPQAPAPIANLDEARVVPWALAGFFAALATAGLTHALTVAGRRWRRDIAVMGALGFVHRQVRGAVQWQAVLTVLAGAVIGVPIGLLVGRSVWARVAHGLGVADDLAAPVLWTAIAVLASVLVGVLIAAVLGRAMTRHSPAAVLRTE